MRWADEKGSETSNELGFRSDGNKKYRKYSSLLFLLFPLLFFPENMLGLCMKPSCRNSHTSLEILVWQHTKASAAEQKGTRQSSCTMSVSPFWQPACSVQLGKTNGKWSLPIQLLHADFVFQMEAVLYYLPCLSFCHVSFLLPVTVSFFFVSEMRVGELPFVFEKQMHHEFIQWQSYTVFLRILKCWFSFVDCYWAVRWYINRTSYYNVKMHFLNCAK